MLGLGAAQDAASLVAAPVCTSGQSAGCRLDERVTVVDLYTQYPTRGSPARYVKVRMPDNSTGSVQDGDGDLYSLLRVSEQSTAELWKGSIVRLDDAAGHYLIAEDSPARTGSFLPLLGASFIGVGAILLALLMRSVLRQRRA